MAKFKYPAECVGAHGGGCVGPGRAPPALYPPCWASSIGAPYALAPLVPHGLATDLPQVLAPNVKPGIWFHDLPALATLRGTIAAVDVGTTPAGSQLAARNGAPTLGLLGPVP